MAKRRPEGWCLIVLLALILGATAYRFVWKSEGRRAQVESVLERARLRPPPPAASFARSLSPVPAPSIEYEVVPLIGREYFPSLKEAIGKAERSIRVAMYLIDPGEGRDHPVSQILEALAAANRRGVAVSVIVECPWGKKSPALKKKNSAAIDRLRRRGIAAAFDEPRHCLHDKLVVIDDRVVFIGNHNWTREALTIHDEVSVRIVCRPPDPRFGRYVGYIGALPGETTEEEREEKLRQFQNELLIRSREEGR